MQAGQPDPDLAAQRLHRLRSVMADRGIEALLTADPINIFYATGVRNMSVFSMMGAARFALVPLDGPVVVWEFAGAEHLAEDAPTVDEVRTAPGITALSGPGYPAACAAFAREIAASHRGPSLAVERVDHPVTDALRDAGLELSSATDVFVEARVLKLPAEIDAMWAAMHRVEAAVAEMLLHLEAGRTEVEVWSHFHRHLIETGGEYVSTRLVQAGARTFPYFQEAGLNPILDQDLFCIDTDAIGIGGYGADFSRTYVCGEGATDTQQTLHGLAHEQLTHNAGLLGPGVSFEAFASHAWTVPGRHAPHGYYCLAHGLGLSGEYPYVPLHEPHTEYPLPGRFEPGMVICIESYIGDADLGRGVKLEDQFLITEHGAEPMSTLAFDPKLTR